MPEGPLGRIGPPFGFYTYLVWKFAEHRELAERFLVDHAGALRDGLLASGFQNMPNLPSAVPDLAAVLAADPGSVGAGKYAALAGSPDWSVNFGYPGYSNVAIGEVYARGVLPRLVARVVTGRASAEAALDDADAEVRAIFARFREEGRI
jgi:multiple sugar transport system substrate-binding protein